MVKDLGSRWYGFACILIIAKQQPAALSQKRSAAAKHSVPAGSIASGEGGFQAVFFICAAVYLSSFVTWNIFMKGEKVRLS